MAPKVLSASPSNGLNGNSCAPSPIIPYDSLPEDTRTPEQVWEELNTYNVLSAIGAYTEFKDPYSTYKNPLWINTTDEVTFHAIKVECMNRNLIISEHVLGGRPAFLFKDVHGNRRLYRSVTV